MQEIYDESPAFTLNRVYRKCRDITGSGLLMLKHTLLDKLANFTTLDHLAFYSQSSLSSFPTTLVTFLHVI